MGLRRSGKTTLLRRILTPQPDRLVIVDTLGELAARRFAEYVTIDQFRAILQTKQKYRLAVIPSSYEEFEYITDGTAARTDTTLAIDEIDMWLPLSTMLPPSGVLNMALTGGHYNQSLVCVTHRPVTIHHSIMSQGILWCFPMFDALDRQTVQRYTRRMSNPSGVDPGDLCILETDAAGWIQRVQIARVGHTDVQFAEFDLRTGSLLTA